MVPSAEIGRRLNFSPGETGFLEFLLRRDITICINDNPMKPDLPVGTVESSLKNGVCSILSGT